MTTIVISIAVQIYFNFKNYQKNKQQFINQVQISLDNATDIYFVELAKNKYPFFSNKLITNPSYTESNVTSWASTNDKISITINNSGLKNKDNVSPYFKTIEKIILSDSNTPQEIKHFVNKGKSKHLSESFILTTSDNPKDSVELITGLTSIYLSITNDSLDINRLDNLLKKELNRKKINLNYTLNYYTNNKVPSTKDRISTQKKAIKTLAKSTYLDKNEKIELLFNNQTKVILKKGMLGILLSLLLSMAIIASLFYLLNIIKKQKAIAEIKNDFISNITHEFKTPITTISAAIEAIRNFNALGNKDKTKEYLSITNKQLKKLNIMVEKVLETSTLDSESLLLQKENTNIVALVEKCIANQHKDIILNREVENIMIEVDNFHFENVINNLLDNAIKYGGNSITVTINTTPDNLSIDISDSGSIPKMQKDKIFDKFYRIPQGDTHDVKGFGIGLYYAKKIIEKHDGTLQLLATKNTTFQINLPL
jgi:two-component system phosphate regulon sensor histidine kinase PhoR